MYPFDGDAEYKAYNSNDSSSDGDNDAPFDRPGGGAFSNFMFVPVAESDLKKKHENSAGGIRVRKSDVDPADLAEFKIDPVLQQEVTEPLDVQERPEHMYDTGSATITSHMYDDDNIISRSTGIRPPMFNTVSEPPHLQQMNNAPRMAYHAKSSSTADFQQRQHQINMNSNQIRNIQWDICYLTASPLVFGHDPFQPLEQLNIKEEREEFFKTLKQSQRRLRVIHMSATASNIIESVTGGCRIIHYSGHGIPDYLAFEDRKKIGETHLLHYDQLRKICTDEDRRISFVFVSACHSQTPGLAFVEAGIEHVVAVNTQFALTDEAAGEFTKHFYYSILSSHTILRAFEIARQAVEAMSSSARLDSDKFLLLPLDGDHNVRLFDDIIQEGDLEDCTPQSSPNNLPPPVQPFIGRAIDMRNIISLLTAQGVRLLVLTGKSGSGKSATSQMVAKYFCDRRLFPGGVFHCDVSKLSKTYQNLDQMLEHAFDESENMEVGENRTNLWNRMRHNSKDMLLVFDGLYLIENKPDVRNRLIQAFLQNVFDRTSAESKVIVTCTPQLQHIFSEFRDFITRFHELPDINQSDSAKLFCRLSNQFVWQEVERNRPLVRLLNRNPARIAEIARTKHEFNCKTLNDVVEKFTDKEAIMNSPLVQKEREKQRKREAQRHKRQQLIEQRISTHAARQRWSEANGFETVHYSDMFRCLEDEFLRSSFSQRHLRDDELIEPFLKRGMAANRLIPIEAFESIYDWFRGLCDVVAVLAHWWNQSNPVIGFMSRVEAESKLNDRPSGTFLIRVSSTVTRGIAISYRQEDNRTPRVMHLLAVLIVGTETWKIKGSDAPPMTLNDFIRTYSKLQYIYNDTTVIPKRGHFN